MSVRNKAQVAKLERSVVMSLAEQLDSPRSLTVWMLLKYHEYDQVFDLNIRIGDYEDPQRFADDYLVTSALSKSKCLPSSRDPKASALAKFWDAEKICQETNDRLDLFMQPNSSVVCPSIVEKIQYWVQRILGPHPTKEDLRFIEDNCRFGPGATSSLSGVVSSGKKYSSRPVETTPRLVDFRTFFFPPLWKESVKDLRVRRSSKVSLVPKKATCDRTICIEPDLNIFVQLGLGACLRRKLLDFGLDLNTQENNRELARRASIDNHLCTMDLSSASDLISRSVVWLLLPYKWADALYLPRVDFFELDGKEHEFHKWSSMGNGYTFELETVIFYAVLLACCEVEGCLRFDEIIAYGDDLIFPKQAEERVRETLELLGFKVNPDKTFGEGPFRESCGTDWWLGRNVRPFFLKSDHPDFDTVCFIYANMITAYADNGVFREIRYLPAWRRCFSAASDRPRIPKGFGDVGFWSSFDEALPSFRRKDGWAGYRFKYREVPVLSKVIDDFGSYLNSLRHGSDFTQGFDSLRGRYLRPRSRSGYSLEWPDLGPWH